jgi:hypothetical protein
MEIGIYDGGVRHTFDLAFYAEDLGRSVPFESCFLEGRQLAAVAGRVGLNEASQVLGGVSPV